jgi:peptidoglycan/xylan/chitin deacetylase (PgdA/CDA1 family)
MFAQSSRSHKRLNYCALTFDDGYGDFLHYAWPEIQRHNFPATVFLPTAIIGTPARFWWDELYHASMTAKHVPWNSVTALVAETLQRIMENPVTRRPARVYELIEQVQAWSSDDLRIMINALSAQNESHAVAENGLLTWDEVRFLHRNGVQFGSHTRHHCNLQAISVTDAQEEIAVSKQELQEILQEPVDTFAFPGGHMTEEALRILAASGYVLACSTRKGMNRRGEDVFRLRRVNIWDGVVQDFRGRFSPAVLAFNLMRFS